MLLSKRLLRQKLFTIKIELVRFWIIKLESSVTWIHIAIEWWIAFIPYRRGTSIIFFKDWHIFVDRLISWKFLCTCQHTSIQEIAKWELIIIKPICAAETEFARHILYSITVLTTAVSFCTFKLSSNDSNVVELVFDIRSNWEKWRERLMNDSD